MTRAATNPLKPQPVSAALGSLPPAPERSCQDAGLGGLVGGGRHVRADPWSLRLRRGIRHRAQVPRDAALEVDRGAAVHGAWRDRRAHRQGGSVVATAGIAAGGAPITALTIIFWK